MTPQETAQLLTFINTWQALPMSDENAMKVTLGAWNEALDDDLPLDFAMKTCQAFFAEATYEGFRKIMPGDLNKPWRNQRRVQQERRQVTGHSESKIKCPFPDCVCTHDNGCVAGWIDRDDAPTSPCPVCRPGLRDLLTDLPPPGQRSSSDFAVLREGRTNRWSNGADKA